MDIDHLYGDLNSLDEEIELFEESGEHDEAKLLQIQRQYILGQIRMQKQNDIQDSEEFWND